MEGIQHCSGGTAHSDARRTRTRPHGNRQSFSHAIDHMLLDMDDRVPSNIPVHSQPDTFENNEAVIRVIMERSQSQFATRVTNSPY